MNPFVLLIKPMMAVGFLVTKMAVAVGYVATEGGPPPSHPTYDQAQVRVAVLPDDQGIGHMEVEMPNGELFELADLDGDGTIGTDIAAAPASSAGPLRARRSRTARAGHDGHGGQVVAMLESTLGRSMRCDVSLASASDNGSARCTVNTGEVYQVTF
jgi:hypothetical protein